MHFRTKFNTTRVCIVEEPVTAHYFKVFTYLKENQREQIVHHKLGITLAYLLTIHYIF